MFTVSKEKSLQVLEWVKKGNALYKKGQYSQAINCYDQALAIDTNDKQAWNNKGIALNAQGHYSQAIDCYDQVLAIDPQDKVALSNKVFLLEAQGHYSQVVDCLNKILSFDPQNKDVWFNKGVVLHAQGHYTQAIDCYDQVLAIDPQDKVAWYNKGCMLAAEAQHSQAIDCYDKALAIDAQYIEAWANKGSALCAQQHYSQGIDCYDQVLAIDVQDKVAWTDKGNALCAQQHYSQAIDCYDKALSIDKKYANAIVGKEAALKALEQTKPLKTSGVNAEKNLEDSSQQKATSLSLSETPTGGVSFKFNCELKGSTSHILNRIQSKNIQSKENYAPSVAAFLKSNNNNETASSPEVLQKPTVNVNFFSLLQEANLALQEKQTDVAQTLFETLLQPNKEIPKDNTWDFGKAVDNGDCFYDVIAQSMDTNEKKTLSAKLLDGLNREEISKKIEQGEKALNRSDNKKAQELFFEGYQMAEGAGDVCQQISALLQLSKIFLDKEEYADAVKLASLAKALRNKLQHPSVNSYSHHENMSSDSPNDEEEIIKLYQTIETRFLCKQLGKTNLSKRKESPIRPCDTLDAMRQSIKQRVKDPNCSSQEILQYTTKTLVELSKQQIQACIEIIGNPPCKYAFMSLGSMSKEEMAPYSDFEFAILIEKEEKQIRQYFIHLVKLLELKFIQFGETPCRLSEFNISSSLPRKGFHIDSVVTSFLEYIIGTPKQLASYQLPPESIEKQHTFLRIPLRTVDYIVGDRSLVKIYEEEKAKILDNNSSNNFLDNFKSVKRLMKKLNFTGSDNDALVREIEALDMMRYTLRRHRSKLDDKKELIGFFNIKEELYRLPNNLINQLLIYYGLTSKNTWSGLEELYSKGILTEKGKNNLKQVMEIVTRYRIKTHLHYESEREEVYHKTLEKKSDLSTEFVQTLFQLEEKDIQNFFEVYRIIIPLEKFADLFCEVQGKQNLFKTSDFCDESLATQAKTCFRLMQYEDAVMYYQQALSIDPNQGEVLESIGEVLRIWGDVKGAKERFKKALDVQIKLYGKNSPKVAVCFKKLGLVYQALGDTKQAINCYKEGLAILFQGIKIIDNSDATVVDARAIDAGVIASFFSELGAAYLELGDTKQAIKYLFSGLTLRRKIYGEKNENIAHSLNSLGAAYQVLGDMKQAIACLKQALKIVREIFGEKHPHVAICFNNLGAAYQALGDTKQAIECLQRALALYREIFGEKHSHVAICFHNLGGVYHQNLNDIPHAIDNFEQALRINRKIYGEEHPNVAKSLWSLGRVYEEAGNTLQAQSYLEQALRIFMNLPSYGKNHSHTQAVKKLLQSINEQADPVSIEGNVLHYYERKLAVDSKVYGEEHLNVAADLNNLGAAYVNSGDAKQAIKYLEQALVILRKVYGEPHPDEASCLNNLGQAYRILGDVRALEYHEQALTIWRKVHDEQHFQVAIGLRNLGLAYKDLVGDVNQAIRYYKQALEIDRKVFGKEHSKVAVGLYNLGVAYQNLGEARQAMGYFEQALAIDRKLYGEQQPQIALDLIGLGSVCHVLGDAEQAMDHFTLALQIFIKLPDYGERHPYIQAIEKLLSKILTEQAELVSVDGNMQQLVYYNQKLAVDRKVYGEVHPKVATDLNNLGILYSNLKNAEQAIECSKQALAICRKVFGEQHQDVARCLNNLGAVYQALGDAKQAISYYEQALEICRKIYGKEHHTVAMCLNNLGFVYHAVLGNARQGLGYYKQALAIDRKNYGEQHYEVAIRLGNLGLAYYGLGETEQAINHFELVLQILIKLPDYGERHPYTQNIKKLLIQILTKQADPVTELSDESQVNYSFQKETTEERKPDDNEDYATMGPKS